MRPFRTINWHWIVPVHWQPDHLVWNECHTKYKIYVNNRQRQNEVNKTPVKYPFCTSLSWYECNDFVIVSGGITDCDKSGISYISGHWYSGDSCFILFADFSVRSESLYASWSRNSLYLVLWCVRRWPLSPVTLCRFGLSLPSDNVLPHSWHNARLLSHSNFSKKFQIGLQDIFQFSDSM